MKASTSAAPSFAFFVLLLGVAKPVSGYDCAIPSTLSSYSFISSGDAEISAKSIDSGVAVGLIFQQILPEHTIDVNGMAYVRDMQADNVHWNGGLRIGNAVDSAIDFQQFIFLAEMAVDHFTDNEMVFVFTTGGGTCWSNDDFGGARVSPNTLVIFNTWQDVCLTQSSDGSTFVPTVIAPFSRVDVQQEIGAVNGTIVARDLVTTGTDPAQLTALEFRGGANAFNGTIACRDTPGPSSTPSSSMMPSDQPSQAPSISDSPSTLPSVEPSNLPR